MPIQSGGQCVSAQRGKRCTETGRLNDRHYHGCDSPSSSSSSSSRRHKKGKKGKKAGAYTRPLFSSSLAVSH